MVKAKITRKNKKQRGGGFWRDFFGPETAKDKASAKAIMDDADALEAKLQVKNGSYTPDKKSKKHRDALSRYGSRFKGGRRKKSRRHKKSKKHRKSRRHNKSKKY